ncbi:ABC transporter ATP-binding protein [Flavobacteriaceae bacterium 14752]|uniref:ABC transporter ATP-binding protein n=1 Tax=Mesohalobacter salilacus TaxID=2491711 RepID=UPI000F62D659|nr:ATP-binding cassette domain-containing protein [Flavobacteriaceae bacterium 14752]
MLEIHSLKYSYGDAFKLNDISLKLDVGQTLGIIGQSGCGKTTLLKLIFGELDANQGEIYWHKEKILGPSFQLIAGREDFKYVTQDSELMPYTTVVENIIKPLSRQHLEQNISRARELLEVLGLEKLENSKVKNLSGGQQQRVAIAKALAKTPRLLLLDEPFSHIDRFFKNNLRRKLFKFLKNQGITCVIATHDKDDIMPFANKLLVLKDGKKIALDTPFELYKNNKNSYIASLFGDFNQIKAKQIWPDIDINDNLIIYPYEIIIELSQSPEIEIIDQFFGGQFFKIIVQWQSKKLFVLSKEPLDVKKNYKLIFKKNDIKKRYRLNQ